MIFEKEAKQTHLRKYKVLTNDADKTGQLYVEE